MADPQPPPHDSPTSLWRALDFRLSELLRLDLALGVLAGVGMAVLSLRVPGQLQPVRTATIEVVGVIVGVVVAAAALQGAFLDQAFLRKLDAINRNPTHYLAPALFTATVGVFALLTLLVCVTVGAYPGAPDWLRIAGDGVAALLSVWTIASLLYVLDMVVQFLGLQRTASRVRDDAVSRLDDEERGRRRGSSA